MNRPELAKDTDAREILALYRAAAAQAKRTGHSHWDENYPSEETVCSDLAGAHLRVFPEQVGSHGIAVASDSRINHQRQYGNDQRGPWSPNIYAHIYHVQEDVQGNKQPDAGRKRHQNAQPQRPAK